MIISGRCRWKCPGCGGTVDHKQNEKGDHRYPRQMCRNCKHNSTASEALDGVNNIREGGKRFDVYVSDIRHFLRHDGTLDRLGVTEVEWQQWMQQARI